MMLEPFLSAPQGSAAEHDTLRVLLDEVTPVIEGVIRGRVVAAVATGEREELFSEAMLQLIRKLQEIKTEPSRNPIANLSGYAAVTTFNVVHAHFRRAHPERRRLRNRIRHELRMSPRFACWPSSTGAFVCGLAAWEGTMFRECSQAELDRIPPLSPAQSEIARMLDHVFQHARKPVALERLVATIAEWSQQPMLAPQTARRERVDKTMSAESSLIYRSALTDIWREIHLLPARQRIALLLGLRDETGSALTSLLIHLRIATFDELAAAVDLSAEGLAAIWEQLPLSDQTIADRLDLNRQQVINLRKSARERLRRRLAFLRDGKPLLGS